MNKEQIYEEIIELLTTLFDIPAELIKPETNLYEDLELDSIDAVDMIVHLQKKIGKRVAPEDFKLVRSVQDIVNVVNDLLAKA